MIIFFLQELKQINIICILIISHSKVILYDNNF